MQCHSEPIKILIGQKKKGVFIEALKALKQILGFDGFLKSLSKHIQKLFYLSQLFLFKMSLQIHCFTNCGNCLKNRHICK